MRKITSSQFVGCVIKVRVWLKELIGLKLEEKIKTTKRIYSMKEKLIRDNLPELVKKERGEDLNVRIAEKEEMESFLRQKILEEATEVFEAKNSVELAEELADLLEVIKALSENQRIVEMMFLKREAKHKERGGFEKGLILVGDCKK